MNSQIAAIAAAALAATAVLAGCAHRPDAPAFTGSVALLSDASVRDAASNRTQLYVVEAIDGKTIANSIESGSAQGSGATPRIVQRKVPIRPMKLTLHATEAGAASVRAQSAPAAGAALSVTGTVDFTPEPDKEYVVRGELGVERSAVWVEEEGTRRPVTPKVVAP